MLDLWVNKLIEKEEKGIYGYNFYLTNPACYSPKTPFKGHTSTMHTHHTESEDTLLLRTSLLLVSYALEVLSNFPCSATRGGNQVNHYTQKVYVL